MAGNRAASPRTGAPLGSQRDQLVVLGSLVALAIAAVIVLVGLYLTVYRPPREHVLTAGDTRYNAGEVYRRALYAMLYQQSVAPKGQTEIVTKTLELIEREATLRVRGKQFVAEVTAEDVTKELQQLLAPPTPPAPSVSGGTAATVTVSTPTADGGTPTATPTVNLDAYAKALQQRLERSKLTKAELEAIIAAGLYEDRLTAKFKAELPKTAPQVLLVTARIQDQATAERVRSIALRPGVDFGPVAAQNSVSDARGARAGTTNWVIVDQLEPAVRDVVKNLKAGDVSAVTQNGTYYEVHKVLEVSASRDLSDELKDQMAIQQVLQWLTAEGKNLTIERDLTTQKEQWITDHVMSAYTKASATPRAR